MTLRTTMHAPASTSGRPAPGSARIGRYVVTGSLGKGAMGTVYRAEDPLIGRKVALKVLSLDLSEQERVQFREQFFSEGRAAGRLNHPNIVTIYDIGESEGVPYIAMEFLQGYTLREALDSGSVMPVRRVVDIGLAVCRGLDFAHSQGVIHRDIKPANIMLSRSGMVKIMDFGIAQTRFSLGADRTLPSGHVLGSPKYMAPEQIQGGTVDARSDLFALGVTLYELLVGRNPFEGRRLLEVVDKVLHSEPPTARELNPDVPRELDLLLLRAMHKDPAQRFKSAREMASILRMLRKQLRDGPDGGRTLRQSSPTSGNGGTVVLPAVSSAPEDRPAARRSRRKLAVGVGAAVIAAWAAFLTLQRDVGKPVLSPELAPTAAGPLAAAPASLDEVDIFAPPILPLPTVDEAPPALLAPQREPEVTRARAPAPAPVRAEPRPVAKAEPAIANAAVVHLSVLPWGQVFVNGKRVGVTPPMQQLELPAGRHRIEIRNLDFPPFIADLKLESGDDKQLRHRFGQ
ncbi:MAG: serine/threonine protein kinase [Rhodocyclaceae bacterium]|nr:serine/threonine protein kinase [Rhodocyclaceae bacterium]